MKYNLQKNFFFFFRLFDQSQLRVACRKENTNKNSLSDFFKWQTTFTKDCQILIYTRGKKKREGWVGWGELRMTRHKK